MGNEYAPAALRDLAAEICRAVPGARLSGILGDAAHTYGYHRARSKLPKTDYSVQAPDDRAGDSDAASAVDISMPAAQMKTTTSRLLAAAKNRDTRLRAVREFFGTVDGRKVTGWDLYRNAPASSDDSHLWHVHLSIRRKYATDRAALAPILDVIQGDTDMPTPTEIAVAVWTHDPNRDGSGGVANAPDRADRDSNPTVQPAFALSDAWAVIRRLAAKVDALTARVDAMPTTLAPAITSAVADAVANGVPADVLTAAVETAVRRVLGSLDAADRAAFTDRPQ